jgi:hypothetical protein
MVREQPQLSVRTGHLFPFAAVGAMVWFSQEQSSGCEKADIAD